MMKRYIVGYYCYKGGGHIDLYSDPEAEMACIGAPLYMSAEDANWLTDEGLGLPDGVWEDTES
jgi:hypothetical protein